MSLEDRTTWALKAVLRGISKRGPVRSSGRKIRERVEDEWVRAMDGVVSRLSNRPIHTRPKETEAVVKEKQSPSPAKPATTTNKDEKPPIEKPTTAAKATEPSVSSEKQKERGVQKKPEPDHGIFAALPGRYGSGRVALIARDPEWAFAYWDLSLGAGPRTAVRLCDAHTNAVLHQADITPDQNRHYFRLPFSDQRYVVVLVEFLGDGREHEIARSNVAWAPPLFPRAEGEPVFVDTEVQAEVLRAAHRIDDPPRLRDPRARRAAAANERRSTAGASLRLSPEEREELMHHFSEEMLDLPSSVPGLPSSHVGAPGSHAPLPSSHSVPSSSFLPPR